MSNVKLKYKKKYRLRKSSVFILCVILLVLISFTKTIFLNLMNKESEVHKESEVEVLSQDKQDLLNSTDPVIKDLVQKSSKNPTINTILNNIDIYPESLLNLASKNNETIDFVANYSQHKLSNETEKISINNDYEIGKIPLFLQWDKRWGYENYGDDMMAITGCAPTSLAMVVVGLTGNSSINPKVVANYAYENNFYINGTGSSWNLISKGVEHFGLKSEELPLSKSSIISTLKSGNPIILTVKPGTFTSTGHFLVLTGLASNGKIQINDPNSKINSNKIWDVNIFLKETKNLWKISLI